MWQNLREKDVGGGESFHDVMKYSYILSSIFIDWFPTPGPTGFHIKSSSIWYLVFAKLYLF